jgi:hypothetical protein
MRFPGHGSICTEWPVHPILIIMRSPGKDGGK